MHLHRYSPTRTRIALFGRVNGSSPRRTRTKAGFADTKRPMKALKPRSVAGSAASKRAFTKYNPGRANACAGHISSTRLTAQHFAPGASGRLELVGEAPTEREGRAAQFLEPPLARLVGLAPRQGASCFTRLGHEWFALHRRLFLALARFPGDLHLQRPTEARADLRAFDQ